MLRLQAELNALPLGVVAQCHHWWTPGIQKLRSFLRLKEAVPTWNVPQCLAEFTIRDMKVKACIASLNKAARFKDLFIPIVCAHDRAGPYLWINRLFDKAAPQVQLHLTPVPVCLTGETVIHVLYTSKLTFADRMSDRKYNNQTQAFRFSLDGEILDSFSSYLK